MKSKRGFDNRATDVLKDWMLSDEHIEFPYPNDHERITLAEQTGMSVRQVLNWFVNARKRIWQPLLLNLGYDAKQIVTERKKVVFKFDEKHKLRMMSAAPHTTAPAATKLNDGKRKGHWSAEEENFAEKLIEGFMHGILPLKKGTALRTFLASQLNCHPMRISKKFAKQAKLGKSYYVPKVEPKQQYLDELKRTEKAFNDRIDKERLVEVKTMALQKKLAYKQTSLVDDDLLDWTFDWDKWFCCNFTIDHDPFPELYSCVE